MTVALCDALRGSSSDLVVQVGQFATQQHSADVSVLLSVARMYLDSQRFADAQNVLVAAGKQAPRDGDIYRWLGETLLRRGDADRAEKVLQRAIQLGAHGPDAQVWLERARVFRPMQAKAGTRAVAAEVAHTSQPARELLDSMSDNTTDVHLPRPKEFSRSPPRWPPPRAARQDDPRHFSKSAQTYPTAFDPPGSRAVRTRRRRPPRRDRARLRSRSPPWPPADIAGREAAAAQAVVPARNGLNGAATSHRDADSTLVPHPRDVLDALTFAGIYEPNRGGARAGCLGLARRGSEAKGQRRAHHGHGSVSRRQRGDVLRVPAQARAGPHAGRGAPRDRGVAAPRRQAGRAARDAARARAGAAARVAQPARGARLDAGSGDGRSREDRRRRRLRRRDGARERGRRPRREVRFRARRVVPLPGRHGGRRGGVASTGTAPPPRTPGTSWWRARRSSAREMRGHATATRRRRSSTPTSSSRRSASRASPRSPATPRRR